MGRYCGIDMSCDYPSKSCDYPSKSCDCPLFDPQERVIGLCESRCQLYVDDLKVISGCISFAVHDEFLLLTNNTHVCHFFPLNSDPKGSSSAVMYSRTSKIATVGRSTLQRNAEIKNMHL